MFRLRSFKKPLTIFALVTVAGICTGSYIQTQAVYGNVQHDASKLDSRQDKLLAQRNEMSKWLLGLAYATVVGLLALQAKEDSNYRPAESITVMAACGLLVVSIFEAFLFQQATTDVLVKDIGLLYGNYLETPLQIQFYTLLAALVCLAGWFFRPSRLVVASAAAALLLGGIPAQAQTATDGCIRQWSSSRSMDLSAANQARLARVINRLRARANADVAPGGVCEYTWAVADEVRGLVRKDNPDSGDRRFVDELGKLESQTENANLLPGDWVSRLIDLSKFWKAAPYATLNVDSKPEGLEINLKPEWKWIRDATPLQTRIAPGHYGLELIGDGHVLYTVPLDLVAGETKNIQYPPPNRNK